MHRVPNPPKLPVTSLAETRSRGSLKVLKARFGAIFLLAALASVSTHHAVIVAGEPV
jgi:hypothetical protein